MRSSGNVAGLQPPSSPRGRYMTGSSSSSSGGGGPPPVSPKFSPPPSTSQYARPPISPGGRLSSTGGGLQMPPLSPGGGHRTRSNSVGGLSSSSVTPSSRRNEVLNRAHRRVASGGTLGSVHLSGSASGSASNGSGGGGSRPGGRGMSVPRSSTHQGSAHRKHQHLPMRMSMSVDEYDTNGAGGSGIVPLPFPSSPHRPPPSASSRSSPYAFTAQNRLRAVSYDEADTANATSSDTVPQDELDSIRKELRNRRERQALLDQRRRELEEIMSSTPPTRRVVTHHTNTATTNDANASSSGDGGDGVSPLKTSDSPLKNKRMMLLEQQRRRERQNQRGGEDKESLDSDFGADGGADVGGVGGVGGSSSDDNSPTVVSSSPPGRDGEKASYSDNSSSKGSGGGGGRPSINGGGRRGRSLTPRVRDSGSLLQQQQPPPTSRRLMSHSPAPQNVGVRRLGRAVDAVLARRRRRGSLSSASAAGNNAGGGSSSSSLDPIEHYQQSLTDEEKHVLAKIIVAVDTKLEKELDLVKSDLQDKTKRESRVQEELKKEKEKVSQLERELEQARSSVANGGATLKHNEASQKAMDDKLNNMETEHEMSLRAVQRVLADVTTDKDSKIEELQQKLKELATANESLSERLNSSDKVDGGTRAVGSAAAAAGADGTTSEARDAELKKRDDTIQSLEKKVGTLTEEKDNIEKEHTTSKAIAVASMSSKEVEVSKRDESIKALQEQLATVTSEKENLQLSLKSGDSSNPPSPAPTTSTSNEEGLEQLRVENIKLKKDLSDKISSLETAKMMITSLESASGAQANDLRAKLKERNAELASLKVRADNSDSELATLKSELVHMHNRYAEAEKAAREAKIMLKKQRSVHRQLKAEITKISSESNSVQCNEEGEVEVEVSIGGEVSSVVQKSLSILAEGDKSSVEPPEDDREQDSSEMDTLRKRVEGLTEQKDAAMVRLDEELVQKNVALNNMDDQLKLQKEECDRLRSDLDKARNEFQQSLAESQFEIQRLTDDFTFANEQLNKKEKELNVLKESLNEPSTGYISDDDDFDDEDDDGGAFVDAAARQANISAEADNLQLLLLSQGNAAGAALSANYAERLKSLEKEVVSFRTEQDKAAKQIKEKEEALVNAKMIISSLEKSNKSMLEDLRNRLHDSNTAIVSLLSKNQNMEGEMEGLRKAKEEEVRAKEEEAKKLKEEALDSADKLADLRERVDNYQKIARRMGVDDASSMVSSLGTASSYESDMTSDDLGITTDEEAGRFPTMSPSRKPQDGEEEV